MADPTAGMNDAYGMIRSLAGSPNPYTGEIEGMFRNSANAPAGSVSTMRSIDNVPGMAGGAGGSTQDYMNPYIQSVLNPQLRELGNAQALNQNKLDSVAAMGGAFGDARAGFQAAQNNKDYINSVGDTTGQAYSGAHDRAMALKQADIARLLDVDKTNQGLREAMLGRQFAGGNALMGLDKYNTGRGVDLANTMNTYGKEQRGIEQAKMDAAYEEFSKRTGYPIEIAKLMVNANNPAAYGKTEQGATQQPDNTGWGILGALGGTALTKGLFGNMFGGQSRFG